jgi:hypothetical protein
MSQQDYVIHYAPLFNTLRQIDIQALIDKVDDPWYNQTLIQVGGGGPHSRADDRESRIHRDR